MTQEDVGPMVTNLRWKTGALFGISFRHKLTETVLNHLRDMMEEPLQVRMARLMGL